MTSPLPTDEDAREYTPSTIEVLCRYQEWAGGSSSDEVRRAEFERWLAGFRRSVVSRPHTLAVIAERNDLMRREGAVNALTNAAHDFTERFNRRTRAALLSRARQISERVEKITAPRVSAPPTITDERIAAALRLHPKHYLNSFGVIGEPWRPIDNMTGQEKLWCGHCVKPWPCPTVAALGGEA